MTQAEVIAKIQAAAARYGIDPNIAVAQARAESSLNPNARAADGGQGLMQFMPGTWAAYGAGGDPFDIDDNLNAWGRYMSKLLAQFGGRYDLALAGYNSGENRAEYAAAAREGRAINWAALPAKTQQITKPYLIKILGSANPTKLPAAQTRPGATRQTARRE